MSSVPKAVLYYSPNTCWSSVVLLALHEKGYGDDELEYRVVNLAKGENFSPSFLRLNNQATVPTLIVPLQKTLSEDVESRYKPVTTTKTIIEFLDKSRSPLSHTHTTSDLPAPSLAPATIAFRAISDSIIDLLHSDIVDPDKLAYLNASDDESLRVVSETLLPFVRGRSEALERYLADAESGAIHVTEKVKGFWRQKKTAKETLSDVFVDADKSITDLGEDKAQKRKEYYAAANEAWKSDVKGVLDTINKEITGPLIFGEQVSLADLHLTGWLSCIAFLVGVDAEDDGKVLESKLQKRIGELQSSKLAVFWDTIKTRPSWKKIYASGLH